LSSASTSVLASFVSASSASSALASLVGLAGLVGRATSGALVCPRRGACKADVATARKAGVAMTPQSRGATARKAGVVIRPAKPAS
jgi:hypothetical protein